MFAFARFMVFSLWCLLVWSICWSWHLPDRVGYWITFSAIAEFGLERALLNWEARWAKQKKVSQ